MIVSQVTLLILGGVQDVRLIIIRLIVLWRNMKDWLILGKIANIMITVPIVGNL